MLTLAGELSKPCSAQACAISPETGKQQKVEVDWGWLAVGFEDLKSRGALPTLASVFTLISI
jgi:hypothetical protein